MSGNNEQPCFVEAKRIHNILPFLKRHIENLLIDLTEVRNLVEVEPQDIQHHITFLSYWIPPYRNNLVAIIEQLGRCSLSPFRRQILVEQKDLINRLDNLNNERDIAIRAIQIDNALGELIRRIDS